MTAPKFYGQLEDEGRFTGYPFDGLVTSLFKEQRSRIDAIAFEALKKSLGRELNEAELASVTITWLHSGTDIAPWWVRVDGEWVPATNVLLRAPCPLRIVYLWDEPVLTISPALGFGRWVLGETPEGWHILFAHMETIDVSIGDVLDRGESLGVTGTTGFSTGIHTHVMVMEPVNGVAEWQEWPGRRDYLDYLTMNVDPHESWPEPALGIPEVGDETPVLNIEGWEKLLIAIRVQLAGGQHAADIKYGLVVKRNRLRIELDYDPSITR